MEDMSVRRLLNRRAALDYLKRFAILLPDVTLALVEESGRIVTDVCYREGGELQVGQVGSDAVWDETLPLTLGSRTVGRLAACGAGLVEERAREVLALLHHSLTLILERALEGRSLAQETLERYREINLLYSIGETISVSLDPDEIPDLVMAEATRVIRADGGVVLLIDDEGAYSIQSQFGEESFTNFLPQVAASLLEEALESGKPHIWSHDQLAEGSSAVGSILEAPLKTRERVLGCVLLGRVPGQPIFTADDEKLLTALAAQAAIAVDNARLFADVKNQRDAIAAMKNYMDNIFASIASGVITIDTSDLVTLINRAAERILSLASEEILGKSYTQALPEMSTKLASLINIIKQRDESVVGYEVEQVLPRRGPVVLRLNLSPIKDNREETNGIAIVMDDLTERRQLEAQVQRIRQTFEQYVVPHVVEQLLSNPNSVRLGGVRRDVSILFADIRGFTAFSEKLEPEASVEVLNHYLTLAAEAILAEEGTLDKFIGDGVMAIYNAPLAQTDHTLRAVQSALAIRDSITNSHRSMPADQQLNFGVGITMGPAVVGSIGSDAIRNYTAIGDTVNLASRLQSHAGPGQVLLNVTAYERVCEFVHCKELGYIHVKGHSEPDLVFEVLGLK